MFIPTESAKNLQHQKNSLACKFSLLVWNIHKENQTDAFQKSFSTLMQNNPSDILLLQEVKYPKKSRFFFQEYSFSLAANIQTQENLFGVLTATKSLFHDSISSLSTKKELGFSTHKSFLISKHQLCDKQTLYLVNIHAINFVPLKTFADELSKIKELLLPIKEPLIVAGDFNNWNKKRLNLLNDFQKELGLCELAFKQQHHVKKIFSHELDHIYYRGLTPLNAAAIETKNISDHNPLYALFELQS
ncbi:endonuclease/exonuclease/phosphatase family protein [Sulfurimonas sp.]|uniref:endonuclease/exonuclease/phosphatase family protein n=1 Tax=Sulfurimonas sp. TaxID=2022749 RepID=UPI002603156C|nr:endonuclease/exonuclease/phosphatase family protein [Sulfurimonas sp.]